MDELKTEEAHLLLDVFQYIKHITNEETEKTRIIEDNKRKYEKNVQFQFGTRLLFEVDSFILSGSEIAR